MRPAECMALSAQVQPHPSSCVMWSTGPPVCVSVCWGAGRGVQGKVLYMCTNAASTMPVLCVWGGCTVLNQQPVHVASCCCRMMLSIAAAAAVGMQPTHVHAYAAAKLPPCPALPSAAAPHQPSLWCSHIYVLADRHRLPGQHGLLDLWEMRMRHTCARRAAACNVKFVSALR